MGFSNAVNLLAQLTRRLISELMWYVQQSSLIKFDQIHIYPFQMKLYTLLEPHLTFYFESNIILLKCRHRHVYFKWSWVERNNTSSTLKPALSNIHSGNSCWSKQLFPAVIVTHVLFFLWNWDSAHDNGKNKRRCLVLDGWMDGEE